MPPQGHVILWVVAAVVLIIGIVEIATRSWKYEEWPDIRARPTLLTAVVSTPFHSGCVATYAASRRIFWIFGTNPSHRGHASIECLGCWYPRAIGSF